MPNNFIETNVFKISQPAGDFYVGSMNYSDLMKIAYYDPRVKQGDKYKGIQRPLNKDRIKAINAYLNSLDASLPNAIIASLHSGFSINGTPCVNVFNVTLSLFK